MSAPPISNAPARPARRPPTRRSGESVARLALLGVLATAALTIGWLWLRDSPIAEVEKVEISGATSSQAAAVRTALADAATEMTTLHVRQEVLDSAVEPYESVASVSAEGDFPDRLAIKVVERRQVAVVEIGGAETAVDPDGRLLRGVEPRPALPELDAGRVVASDRVDDARALGAVEVLAEAPPDLHARIERVSRGERGMVLEMDGGPDLIFGDASRPHAKWAAAARVLAEPSAVGSVYLDVRLPERVAAGGVAPTPEPSAASSPVPPVPTPTPAPETTPVPTPAPPAAPVVP